MHNRFSHMNLPGMFLTWLIPLAVFLVIILSIYMINKNNNDNKESALDILDKRYVSGEIDEEEYLKKKERLMNR